MTPILTTLNTTARAIFSLLLFAGALFAAAPEKKSFDLPADAADAALRKFSTQAKCEVIFAADTLGGVKTKAVRGEFTPEEAVAQLLDGTGLKATQDTASGAFMINRAALPNAPRAVAAPSPARPPQGSDEALVLTPFEVTASSDTGYAATETLAGSRLKMDLRDVAQQVNVMTKEFLEDLSITTLDDAMQYSLNTETRFESFDVSDINATGLNDSLFVVGSGQGGRTRGLSASNNSHDFFDTFVRMDSYNTERFTFASGPNSILFGNSSPAGTIDTTLKRARVDRRSLEVSTRATSTESVRLSTDLNLPLVKRVLAFRVAGLTDRDKSWRKPGFNNQDRLYTALTYSPAKWITLRAYNESANYDQQPVKNTLAQDHVTPWIKAGKPLFDNGLGKTLPNAAALLAAPFNGSVRLPAAAVRPVIRYDASGFLGYKIEGTNNSALGSGYEDITAAPNNFKRSVTDESIFPYDRNFNGLLSQAKYRSWIRGGLVELNPLKNFFIEGGYNQEGMFSRGIEFMDGRAQELNVDPNIYLPDRVTLNPKVGQYYFENGVGGVNNRAVKGYARKQQARLSFSYELSFEQNKGWTKWLGMHRAALLLDRLESTLVREESLLTTSPFPNPPLAGNPYAFSVANNQNALRPGFRYYINPAKGDYSVKLPFDPMVDGTYTQPGWVDANGKQVYVMSFDPSGGQINAPSVARNKVESVAFATQSYFLDRRLVLSYGRRRDAVDIYNDPAPVADWNFDRLVKSGVNWQLSRSEVPVKTLKSAVVHPFPWLSFSYSETDSQQVRTEVIRNPDGVIAPTGSGIGKDYGVTLRYKGWFSVRLNKYENTGLGNSSGVANAATATTQAGTLGNQFKQTVAALERSVQAGAPDFDPANPNVAPPSTVDPRFAYYQQDLARITNFNDVIGSQISSRYTVLSDSVAKGYELTLTANPTSNWRISVTGAKNSASESNIGGPWFDFVRARLPIWGSAANLAGGSVPSAQLNRAGVPVNVVASTTGSGVSTNWRTYSDVLTAAIANWNFIQASENRLNNNLRKYRFTATSRYSFSREGLLKGVFVGGNYVWRSAAAVGYPVTTSTGNSFQVTGLNPAAISVSDVTRPYFGGALMSFDTFTGYSRRIANGKINWRIQLNVRNVLNRDGLLVQRTLTDGTGAVYTVQDPRSFILTNTFSF